MSTVGTVGVIHKVGHSNRQYSQVTLLIDHGDLESTVGTLGVMHKVGHGNRQYSQVTLLIGHGDLESQQ